MGDNWGPNDDCRDLAFTVCGSQLTTGEPAPGWIASLNGCPADEIAAEALKRKAIIPKGRWWWRKPI